MHETETLSLCLQTPGCLPPFVWGDFGTGKTQRITAIPAALGWDCEVLRPAERGEGAFGVVPVPSEDRQTLHYPAPDWARRLLDSDRDALVFIDEASSIPPALQPPIRGLALDGIIGGHRLPPRVRRCAAGTPVAQAAGGWDLAPDLANRWVHLRWESPAAGAWTAWLTGNEESAGALRLDLAAWEKEWPLAKSLGAAFVRAHPGCLHEDASKDAGRFPPAWATPRTWECALRLLASCRAVGRMDLYPTLAQGTLGPAVALEGGQGAWLVWLRDNDLPDPETLLADPALFAHDPQRPDRTFATLLAVAEAGIAHTNGEKLTEKKRGLRWNAAFGVLERALGVGLGKDLVLLPAMTLVRREHRPKGDIGPAARIVCVALDQFNDLWSGR